jgi:hypothetical protein
MTFIPHPNSKLNCAFADKPYQGTTPEQAKYLFVGLDANFSRYIEHNEIYRLLLSYLNDGVTFWATQKEEGIHHPFLLPEYKKGKGWKYHNVFSQIGFQRAHASMISFVELLNVPTYGSKLTVADLDKGHLRRLNNAIIDGNAEYVFIPPTVGKLMNESGLFPWIPKRPTSNGLPLKIWFQEGRKTVYWHYHFSLGYKKFQNEMTKQIEAIRFLIK